MNIAEILANAVHRLQILYDLLHSTLSVPLSSFDPSLLQNVMLGILAIFIPYGIVFLTNAVEKGAARSYFNRLVINDEVFELKGLFVITVGSIVFFSFFSGSDVSFSRKITAIVVAIAVIYLLQKAYWKMVRYSEDNRSFDLSLLRKLKLSKNRKFVNDKTVKAWDGFWSEKISGRESDFNQAFIQTIESGLKKGLYYEAILLFDTYLMHISKRDHFSIGYDILPKVLEWHENMSALHDRWIRRVRKEKESNNKIKSYILKKFNERHDRFWNWHYFQNKALKVFTTELLKRGEAYQLFDAFGKHVDQKVGEWEAEDDKEKKSEMANYIDGMLGSFCSVYFDGISESSSSYSIWEHNFPEHWKIKPQNKDQIVSRVISGQFLQWSRDKLFSSSKGKFDNGLSDVMEHLFVGVDDGTFSAFLKLYLYYEPESAVKTYENFHIVTTFSGYSGTQTDEEIGEMIEVTKKERIKNTAEVIFHYFHQWHILKIYKDDLSKEQHDQWEAMQEKDRKVIVRNVRENKLTELKSKLEGDEMKKIASKDEFFEYSRIEMVELTKNLLETNKSI